MRPLFYRRLYRLDRINWPFIAAWTVNAAAWAFIGWLLAQGF